MRRHLDPATAEVLRKARLLVVAMIGGVVVFTVVAVWLAASGRMGETNPLPPGVLPGVAVAVVVMILTAPIAGRALGPDRNTSADAVPGRWLTGVIVASAVREGAGLLGITLSLVAGSPGWALGLGGLAVAAMVATFPRAEALAAASRRG